MKTKAIFLDLDGTLLNDAREITEGNRAAIRKALDGGHKIIICTGRATVSAKEQARKLGIDGPGCYLIAFNGGVLYDMGQDCIMERSAIPMDLVKAIFREAEVRKIHIQTFDDEQVIVEPRCDDEFLDRYCAKVNMDFSIIDRIDRLKQPPAKMLLIDYYDQTAEENFRKDILAKYGDRLNSFFSCKEYIEIIPKTCGKGLALRRLAEILEIPVEDTIGVGDEANDLTMVEAAGLGVCMANGIPEVKAAADYITERDNNHDGVAEVIEKFVL